MTKNLKVLLILLGIFVVGFFIVIIGQKIFLVGGYLIKDFKEEKSEEWKSYQNNKYLFEIDYPDYLIDIESDANSFKSYFPLGSEDLFFEKIFSINIKEEEYDQDIEYYCDKGIPHTFKLILNGLDFCEVISYEDVENGMGVRSFSYFTIHNKKWITFNLIFSYCVSEDCIIPSDSEIEQEREILERIVSTFQILKSEVDSISDMGFRNP